ncbi:hypothetical protein [Cryobacterium sp. TMT1-66-1]|uniref:hypothetical protein n=1 Tax=Cryobacterium sp. TMT1-66-1 TaxID=1259242 RepID=UPI00106B58E4|nr:hypothetical protein [Cryobacterium sp. TMT1-66-1]TFD04125.1 hypothetical protein E3T29_15845 [Cryobacterium sp. TMT1-66-1]
MSRRSANPVVVYDAMREAATRLMGVYRRQLTIGGVEDPAMIQMRAVLAAVEAVDPHDAEAQRAATDEFRARYAELRGE